VIARSPFSVLLYQYKSSSQLSWSVSLFLIPTLPPDSTRAGSNKVRCNCWGTGTGTKSALTVDAYVHKQIFFFKTKTPSCRAWHGWELRLAPLTYPHHTCASLHEGHVDKVDSRTNGFENLLSSQSIHKLRLCRPRPYLPTNLVRSCSYTHPYKCGNSLSYRRASTTQTAPGTPHCCCHVSDTSHGFLSFQFPGHLQCFPESLRK
jgi:hypothetical protein